MNLKDAPVLITGADGFIGSHLTETLARRGVPVRALCLYNSFASLGWLDTIDPDLRDTIDVRLADIRDAAAVEDAVAGCHAVLHLAALIAIPYSYRAPESYIDTNVKGTLNVLQACRRHSVAKLVHTSTSEVYGSALRVPIDEDHPLQPQSPYSASKIAADNLALSYFHSFETPVAVCRPFNTFGPRQSARAVIPTIITQLAAGAQQIKLGALDPTRDFTYVSDTVEGLIAVAESDAAVGHTLNLGTGYDISIGDLAGLIRDQINPSATIELDPDRLRPKGSEVDRLRADNTRARTLTGWSPQLAGPEGLQEGLAQTIAWFKDPTNLARYTPGTYTT